MLAHVIRVSSLLALFTPMLAAGAPGESLDDGDGHFFRPPKPEIYLPNLRADADVVANDLWLDRSDPNRALLYYAFGGANYGPGHLIVLGLREGEAPIMPAHQVVYRSDGKLEMLPGSAGRFHFETADGHNHWHYDNYAKVTLINLADATERSARKQSFCLVDVRWVGGAPSVASQPESLPDSFTLNGISYPIDCDLGEPGAQSTAEGISAGWMDIYDSSLNDPIVIDGTLVDGIYKLVATVNPDSGIQETSFEDNAATIYIRIQGNTVTVLRF